MGCIFDYGVHFSNQRLLVIIQQLPDTFDTFPLPPEEQTAPAGIVTCQNDWDFLLQFAHFIYNDFIQSAKGGELRLNDCPICKRLVCSRCFLICDDLDMCKQCAAHLEETGSPVLTDPLEAVI